MSERYKCAHCLGTGVVVGSECSRCQGEGYTGNAMDDLQELERMDRDLNRLYENRHAIKQDWDRF